jgi:hypothetical protein
MQKETGAQENGPPRIRLGVMTSQECARAISVSCRSSACPSGPGRSLSCPRRAWQGSGSWLGGESEPVTKRVLLLLDDHAALLLWIWQAPKGHRARSTSCYMPVLHCSGYNCSISISGCSGVFLRVPGFFIAPSSRLAPVLAKPPNAGCMRAMAAQRSNKMLREAQGIRRD